MGTMPASPRSEVPAPSWDEKRSLLAIAKKSIEEPERSRFGPEEWREHGIALGRGLLIRPRGVFVTLDDEKDELRGCIGTLSASRELYLEISKYAVAASKDDPRFPPVSPSELKSLRIKISILSPDRPLAAPEEIRIGIDGVVLRHPSGTAVFLPEVALELGWTARVLLDRLAMKAGLGPNSWSDPEARLCGFETISFGDRGMMSPEKAIQ